MESKAAAFLLIGCCHPIKELLPLKLFHGETAMVCHKGVG